MRLRDCLLDVGEIHSESIVVNTLTAIIYQYLFRSIYVDYLVPVWGYFGYRVENTDYLPMIATDFLAIIPIIFYNATKRISDFFSIIIYIMVYVPSITALQYYYLDYWVALPYQLAFFISMILFFYCPRNIKSNESYDTKTDLIPEKYYFYAGILFAILIIAVFGSKLRLVSFSELYDLRSENQEASNSFPLMEYIKLWSFSFLGPLYIAIGFYQRNKKKVWAGLLLNLLVFMATGLKAAIGIPVLECGLCYYLRKNVYNSYSLKYVFPLVVFILVLLYLPSTASEVMFTIDAVIFMRTIGISALLTPAYIDVFSEVPYTFFSHIGIVNAITHMYPFTDPSMGTAVWDVYDGVVTAMNANANFLITDGISSMGVIGILIVAIVFYYILSLLNKLSCRHDQDFVIAMMLGQVVNISNISLFTTLLSCGLLFNMILMRYSTINKI